MKIEEYVKLAPRTESIRPFDGSDHGRRASRLAHATLGITSEVGELRRASESEDLLNFKEELGDVCWYIAILVDEFSILPIVPALLAESEEYAFGVWLTELADQSKRVWFYNAPASVEKIAKCVGQALAIVFWICERNKINPEEIFEANIRKLSKRYPDKFTDWLALNRDLTAEAEAMKG